ncbi:ROK family protein [Paracoccus cavernae]|uniref:ROK family protein n=1 Tax=Paracoccus cavernae TaxID=1571207 RepID=UPI0035F44DBA
MTEHQSFLGVDVGGTKVHGLLCDADGRILAESREATVPQGGAALADQIALMRDTLCAEIGADAARVAIGVGLPASVDPENGALSAIPNIAEMAGTHFLPLLRTRLDAPVALENDVNAAALGESWLGAGGDPMAFVAIGTGIGMGVVHGGRLLRGWRGGAGEIAFLPLGADAADPALRASGALESRLGGAGWRDAYRAHGGTGADDLAALFAGSDPAFGAALEVQAELLAQAIQAVIAVLAPQNLVLGGSIGSQPRVLGALQAALPRYCLHPPSLTISALANRAGAFGAARAAMLAAATA